METWSKKLQGIRKTECLTIRDHKPCFHPKTTPTSYTVTSCYHIEILQNYAAGIFPALGQGNAAIVLRQVWLVYIDGVRLARIAAGKASASRDPPASGTPLHQQRYRRSG